MQYFLPCEYWSTRSIYCGCTCSCPSLSPSLSLPMPLSLLLLLLLLVCLFLKHPEQYLYTLSIKTLALGHPQLPNGQAAAAHSVATPIPPCGLPLADHMCRPVCVLHVGRANWRTGDLATRCYCCRCAFHRPSTFFGQSKLTHTHTHMYTLAPTHMSFGIGLLWAL